MGALTACLFLSLACNDKQESHAPQRHYQLTGKIVALDPDRHVAMVDAAAIPNYMEAMTMEYPVASKAEFNTLHVGDRITATLNVTTSTNEYNLTGIHKQNAK